MNGKDVTGKCELRALKIKWGLVGNAKSGSCCATGSHIDSPFTYPAVKSSKNMEKPIPLYFDRENYFFIKSRYGLLRT